MKNPSEEIFVQPNHHRRYAHEGSAAFNNLLLHQLQKHLGSIENIPEGFFNLFKAISDSYDNYDKDRKNRDRSIGFEEMISLNNTILEEKEELKKTSRELEQKNAMLQEFGYMVSHDLQEPLRTIVGFVQIFQKRYSDALDSKAQDYLRFILQSTQRMKSLVSDMLEQSRIGAARRVEIIDCNKIMNDVVADLAVSIQESGAEILFDGLPRVRACAVEIKQLFQNLITNAIKFRKKDTPLKITVSASQSAGEFRFVVEDNGIGIDSEHHERIFNIFQKVHTNEQYQGTGIGLSNCRKIIDLHNGRIWVDSTPGQGSAFQFTLPDI